MRPQLALAVVLCMAGLLLLILAFYSPPVGEIHSFILVAYGETLTFAGSLLGNNETYRQMLADFTFEAFMAKTKARDSEKGCHRTYDLETMRARYAEQKADLEYALMLPLKPYIENDIK